MLIAIALAGAAPPPQCRGLTMPRMIERYAGLIRHQQSGPIARLFGADGEIDNPGAAPIRGEAAIARLLGSFKGAVVKSETMTIGAIAAEGRDWRVQGHFHQAGRTPEGKDYDVSGSFDSTWTCTPEGWRVHRMATGK